MANRRFISWKPLTTTAGPRLRSTAIYPETALLPREGAVCADQHPASVATRDKLRSWSSVGTRSTR